MRMHLSFKYIDASNILQEEIDLKLSQRVYDVLYHMFRTAAYVSINSRGGQ